MTKGRQQQEIGRLVMRLAMANEGATVTWKPDFGFTITSSDGQIVIVAGLACKASESEEAA